MSPEIQPITLAIASPLTYHEPFIHTGYVTSEDGIPELLWFQLEIVPNSKCLQIDHFFNPKSNLCAKRKVSLYQTCNIPGGPFVGENNLIGISIREATDCVGGDEVVYVRISYYAEWIRAAINLAKLGNLNELPNKEGDDKDSLSVGGTGLAYEKPDHH